jgi:carbon monoxide dehydrogenase subunit G
MRAFRFVERIARPSREVWDYLTDLSCSSRWRPGVTRMVTIGGGPIEIGTRLHVTFDLLGHLYERESETVAYEPPRRWVLRSERDGITGVFEYLVEPEATARGDYARVTMACDITTGRLFAKVLLPLLAQSERRLRRDQLVMLKRAVESDARQPQS